MLILRRFFWLVTLCFFISGCSYQQFGLPTNTESDNTKPVVKVGQRVTIVTTGGSKFEGEVVSVSMDKIVLGKPSNYGFVETVFRADEIAEIKTEKVPGVVTGVILGAVGLFFLGIIVASQIDWESS